MYILKPMTGNSIDRHHETEITLLDTGVAINLFEKAQVLESGKIIVPERRIALADYSSGATIKVYLEPIVRLEPYESGYDNEIAATGQPPHQRQLRFSTSGKVYAIRNIYPFEDNSTPDARVGQALPEAQLASLAIRVSWDDDQELLDDPEAFVGDSPAVFYDPDFGKRTPLLTSYQERLHALIRGDARPVLVDPRAEYQPIVLSAGNKTAVAIPNYEDWVMQQGYASSALYDAFGVVGGDVYYDKLTPDTPDIIGFIGGTILVPYDLEVVKEIRLTFVLPESVRQITNPDASPLVIEQ